MLGRTLLLLLSFLLLLAPWGRSVGPLPRLPEPVRERVDFVRDVEPLLRTFCIECHNAQVSKGGLRLDHRVALEGEAILVGKSADSPLIHRVAGLGHERSMPPKGPRLTQRQIALLRGWIDQGAAWHASATVTPAGPTHWAYRPLVRPNVPVVRNAAQVRNPIDAFIQAKLESRGLQPAPEADRRTLIRRLSFNLHGLPPTPGDVEDFLKDPRPDASERLVERLLSAPALGERWARHWLDAAHFAETHGHDQDVPRENAWPYRDYLIRAFNADKPYARFIEDQVAGDVLYPEAPDGIAATGLLAAGPWDESSQQSIREDTLDRKQAQNLDRDDMVTTVMSLFSGATVHCARCHDHKFDPISQAEHYALQAVFAGVDRADRWYDADPAVHHRRQALLQRKRTITEAKSLLPADSARAVSAFEQARKDASWHVLDATARTAHGSVPTRLPDGSIRFGGPRPERDVYTLTATTLLEGVTAVRLEVLSDPALPKNGPGRQDNGNLHLNEFRVQAGPIGANGLTPPPALAIRSAVADFDQAGWTIAMAIDGKPATAWGIYPAVGKSHQATFTFEKPVSHKGGSQFVFTLEQTHGQGHLIGRLRLSVTTAKNPANTQPLPPEIAPILATDASKRTETQRAQLARFALLADVDEQLARLPARQKVYAAAPDFDTVGSFRPAKGCRPVFVLGRGDVTKPLRPAAPGALACVPDLPARFTLSRPDDEGERRAALARWLSDARNVLTWRTMANRVWHHHFGRGLVATPGDLGRMGATPTHPELLDWLACELRDTGSLKHLHRLIANSAAYRRSCQHDPAAARQDGDNLLLWRMNRTRLDAESVRDAVLSVSGRLDRTMGGPSVKHFRQTPGIHVTPNVDYAVFDLDAPGGSRRSIYRFVFRTLPDPFFDVLDCPDASQFTHTRAASMTALQALALLNDRFMVRQAEWFANRVQTEAVGIPDQVRWASQLALGRSPTDQECQLLTRHAERFGMANVCRVLLNANEFLFVD